MLSKIIYSKLGFLIILVAFLSCKRNFCEENNFYSTYEKRFETNKMHDEFVASDLELKRKIFSTLCISSSVKKMLIVEYRTGTQSFYSRGLLFNYDDSKIYYFKVRNGEIVAGRGIKYNADINKILLLLKEDFSGKKIKLEKKYNDIFDSPIVNVVLYDSLLPEKFDNFNFPSVVLDSLDSQQ